MRDARHAARQRREHERLADRFAHRLRLQPFECRGQRQRRSPRAGMIRCRSRSSAAPPSGTLADRMPAIGSQPVRAAMKTSSSEVSSGGIDSSTIEAVRIAFGISAAATAAGDDAERQADDASRSPAPRRRESRCSRPAPAPDRGPAGPYCSESPKSSRAARGKPAEILPAIELVEAEPAPARARAFRRSPFRRAIGPRSRPARAAPAPATPTTPRRSGTARSARRRTRKRVNGRRPPSRAATAAADDTRRASG